MASKKKEIEIIFQSFKEAYATCTVPWVLNYSRPLSGTALRLHGILMIIGGVAFGFSLIIALYLMNGHLRYWIRPREQRQHIRIIYFLFFMSLVTFLSLVFYNSSGFLDPIGQLYEGFAIVALYLLYCNATTSDQPIAHVALHDVKEKIAVASGQKQVAWVWRTWILVMQILPVRVVTVIAAEVLFGSKCPLSKARGLGLTVVSVLQGTSTGFAVAGVIGYERRTHREQLQGHRPMLKLVAFKGVVGLQAVQEIVFSALGETRVFFPEAPYYVSYNDFTKGIPHVLLLWELTIMAFTFIKAYEFRGYRDEIRDGGPIAADPFRAFISLFSPLDFTTAFFSRSGSAQVTGRSVEGTRGEYELTSTDRQ